MKFPDETSLAVFSLVSYSLLLTTKCVLAFRVIHRQKRALHSSPTEIAADTITIAQPILSGDPLLSEKLACTLNSLPNTVRFIWLVDSSDPEGLRITDALSRTHGNVQVIHCEDSPDSVNPKSFKLQKALDQAQTEYFAVLDDDTTLDARSLQGSLLFLQSCDLYTGLPCYHADAGFWSRLVAHFVNNNAVITYLPLLNFFPPVSINGMFYVLRTQPWRDIGGYIFILHLLCDDYAVKRHAATNGWKVMQGITSLNVQTSVQGASHYVSLMHRWMLFATLLMFDQSLRMQFLLTLMLGIPPLLLWMAMISCVGSLSWNCLAGLGLLLVLRHATLKRLHRAAFGQQQNFGCLLSLLSELLQPFHAVHGLCVRTIRWRSRVIRVDTENQFVIQQGAAP